MVEHLVIPGMDELEEFCRNNNIAKLALFGSALRDDFSSSSDIDLLVKFRPGTKVGLMGVTRIEIALSSFFGDRKIDLRTIEDLSPYIRDKVVRNARLLVAFEEDVADSSPVSSAPGRTLKAGLDAR